jgi:hypothetical protein
MRRLCIALALMTALWAGSAGEAAAQTRADSAAVLLNAAERLRQQGDGAAARAVLELITRDYADTPAAAQVEAMLAAVRRMPAAERPGRTELLIFGATYGAWLGVAVPIILNTDDEAAFGVGLLAGAPAGFFTARAYTRSRPLTEGQARAITFGGTFGTWQGFGWAEVLDVGDQEESSCPPETPCFDDDSEADIRARAAAAVIGGLTGIGVGAAIAGKPITAGTSTAVTHGGLWGTWFGWGLSFLAGTDGEDENLASALVGGDVGLIATGIIAPRWQLSESRARLISIAGVIGGLAGGGLALIVQPEDERSAVAFPLIGSALGLGLGAHWTRGHDTRAEDRNDAGGGAVHGGAVLNLDQGRWALDLPDPTLRLERTGRTAGTAVYVPLLQARF